MKKYFLISTLFLLTVTFSANAQGGGGGMRKTVEERTTDVMSKLTDFKLSKEKNAETEIIVADFYKAQDKMREELMAGGTMPDREVMREKMQQMSAARDEKLKKIFSEEQFKKWTDDIVPALTPQRRPQ